MRLGEIEPSGLLESPQSIEPSSFGLSNVQVNISQANKILTNKKLKQIGTIKDLPLYKCGNTYAIIEYDGGDHTKPMIRYYVQYVTNWLSLIKHQAIQQVLVWRSGGYYGIASQVFFDYLLKETGCLVTDAFQTPDGERFWNDRINDALVRGLFVYYIDILAPNRVVKQLHSMNDLSSIQQIAWGDDQRKQEKRIIITNFNVPEQGEVA